MGTQRISCLTTKTLLDFNVGDWSEYLWQDWDYSKLRSEHIEIPPPVARVICDGRAPEDKTPRDLWKILNLNKAFVCTDSYLHLTGGVPTKVFVYHHDNRFYLATVRG